MRHDASAALFSLLCLLPGVARAQALPATSPTAAPAAAATTPSTLVQPSLTNLERVLGTVDVEKWKLPRQARDDARRNVDSIRQDMTATLPPLLTAADASPGAVPAQFAMLRNVDALYDVALRLSATAAVAAPAAQATALDQALGDVLQARRSLAEHTLADATAEERLVSDLQGKVQASAAAPPVCPAAVPAAAVPKSKVKRSKPRPKPVPAAPATPQ